MRHGLIGVLSRSSSLFKRSSFEVRAVSVCVGGGGYTVDRQSFRLRGPHQGSDCRGMESWGLEFRDLCRFEVGS